MCLTYTGREGQQLLLFAQLCLDIYELLYDIAEAQCCEGQELFEASDLQQHEHVRLTVKCYLIFSLLEDFLKKNQFQPIPSLVAHLDDVLCEYRESAQQCLEPQSLVANFIAHATAYKIEFYTTIIKRKQDAEPHLVAQLSTGCEVTEPEQQSAYLQATWHFMVAQSMMAEERPDQAMDSALRALAFCCMIQNDNLLEIPGVIVLQRELTQSQKLYYQILQWINHTVMPSLESHSSCEQQQEQLLEIKARWRAPRLGRPPRPGRRGRVSSVFCDVESEEDDQDPGYYTGTQPSPSGVEPDTAEQHVFNS